MQLVLLTPPAAEPVEVDDVKLALRIDGDEFDVLLPGLIAAARQVAEQETGRAFIAQTWRAELDDWPSTDDEIRVYRPSACAVTYWNGSAWVTLSGAGYVFAAINNGTRLAPALDTSWPDLGDIALGPRVRIDLTAGVAASVGYDASCEIVIAARKGMNNLDVKLNFNGSGAMSAQLLGAQGVDTYGDSIIPELPMVCRLPPAFVASSVSTTVQPSVEVRFDASATACYAVILVGRIGVNRT